MSRSKGFTLVEAAIAIGVVAILSGIIIPLVLKNLNDARMARARNEMQVIGAALAAQMRDTGTRPRAAAPLLPGAVAAATGLADADWHSAGTLPDVIGGPFLFQVANTFENLFVSDAATGNPLFGLPAVPLADAEFHYRPPYLGHDMVDKSDPWGHAYVILGFNADGIATGGPIWIVSAGEEGRIAQANLAPLGGPGTPHRNAWNYGLPGSEKNIAIRIN